LSSKAEKNFSNFSPPITSVAGPWFRVHKTGKGAVFFGRSGKNRWDSPDQSYGVMYAGETWQGAFMESVLHDPVKKRVMESELEKSSMALLKTTAPLRLIDVSETKVLRALEISESDTKAAKYGMPQSISKAIHTAGWNVHGIRYASRLAPAYACLALFDCPVDMIAVHDLEPLLAPANDGLVRSILAQYEIQLVDDIAKA
jgi:hypothetical protein